MIEIKNYDRSSCKHNFINGTLILTYDARTKLWSGCCTSCRQWTGWTLTRDEAKARSEKGQWCK